MKKRISVLLAIAMIISVFSAGVSAAVGSGLCYHLYSDAVYGYFDDFSMNANDSIISFDISMAADSDGAPRLTMNSGNEIIISSTSVSLAGQSAAITWGELTTTHWRHVEITYKNGTANVVIDGATALTVSSGAYCRTSGITFVGWPGTILIDNLRVSNSSGTLIKYIDFDDEGVYLNSKNPESTAVRTNVPSGSYTDYTGAADYSLIFDSATDVAALSGSEFSASQNAAKLTYNGTDGEAGNSFIDLTSAGLSADDYPYAVITYMTPNSTEDSNSSTAQNTAILGAIGSIAPQENLKKSFALNTDGRYHSEIIKMSELTGWTGAIYGLQLRYFEAASAGDSIYIDSIVLCNGSARANAVAATREAAKSGMGIFDQTEPNKLGFADGSSYVCNFDSQEDMQFITESNNSSYVYDSTYNAMKCTATGTIDPNVYVDLSAEGISADTYKYIVYTYRMPSSVNQVAPKGNFYYVCGSITVPTGGYESNIYDFTKDGLLHYVVVDLSAKSNWNGNITGLRIDYFNEASINDTVYIDSIVFCTTEAVANVIGTQKVNPAQGEALGSLQGDNYVCNFDSASVINYVTAANNTNFTYDSANNALKCTVTGASDPNVYIDLSNEGISANSYKYIVYTYRIPTSTVTNETGNFYYVCGNITVPTTGYESPYYSFTKDGELHYAVVDLSSKSNYTGTLKGLRIDYFNSAFVGDTVYIDSIIFCSTSQAAIAAGNDKTSSQPPSGTTLGEVDGENYVCNFDSAAKAAFVSNGINTSFSYDSDFNALKCTATGTSDPSIYVDLTNENISADVYKYIVYTYRIPTSNAIQNPSGNFYYVCGAISGPTSGYESNLYSYTRDGNLHYEVVDLSSKSNWSGNIKGLRIDYFTNATIGDKVYIDSIVFCKTAAAATEVGNSKTVTLPDPSDAAAVWNYYWMHAPTSGNEFMAGSASNLNLYLRYNSSSAVTQTSISDRLEKTIEEVTGAPMTVEVYTGFMDIKDSFKTKSDGQSASNEMQFILTPANGPTYCIWVNVTLIMDTSCSSYLNGNDTIEPDPTYPNLSQTSVNGVTVTDSSASLSTSNGLAVHSNHETRVLHAGNKTFAVYPTGTNGEWNDPNSSQFQIYEIGSDGSATSFYTGSSRNCSSKPNIMLGYDGLVYVFFATDANGSAQLDAYYFNPSASTYSVTKVSATKSYNGGVASGGYGYTQPVLDNAQKKVHMIFCGGQRGTGDFAWFTFNQETKSWESNAQHISIGNRHCYVYAYADGQGGVNIVAERDVLLVDLGLGGVVTGADYAWDELSLFHIPDMYASSYTKSTFAPADYTQAGRTLYPVIQNNSWGDTYLASDGKLHILYLKSMHGTNHHDVKYNEIWHAVYDTTVSGTPELLYNKPIKFVNEENNYACRFAESTDGDLYILAMPANVNARIEIWASADVNDFTFSFDSAYTFTNTETTKLSLIVSGPRNGSTQNNVIDCMYPTGSGTYTYRYFKVTLP